MTREHTRECGHCQGAGRVELPLSLREVIAMLSGWGILDTTSLARRLDTPGPAMVNRLRELEGLGLVRCLGRTGRALRWERVRPR